MPKLVDIVQYLNETLNVSKIRDDSLNGLQVEGASEVKKIALGVDASMELFEKAERMGANLIIVHHGLFWAGKDPRAVGIMANRLKFLLECGISLYVSHLPLDVHESLGNNAQIAAALGLKKTKPFAAGSPGDFYGVMGELEKEMPLEACTLKIENAVGKISRKDIFGKKSIKHIAIVSGGGAAYAQDAAKAGADLLLTGEPKHAEYHNIRELEINAVFTGHYMTETFGVVSLGKAIENRFKGLKTEFISCPTGL